MKFLYNFFSRLLKKQSELQDKPKEQSLVDLGKFGPVTVSRTERRRSTNYDGRGNVKRSLVMVPPTSPRRVPEFDERGTPIIRQDSAAIGTYNSHTYKTIERNVAGVDTVVTASAVAYTAADNGPDDDLDVTDAVASSFYD